MLVCVLIFKYKSTNKLLTQSPGRIFKYVLQTWRLGPGVCFLLPFLSFIMTTECCAYFLESIVLTYTLCCVFKVLAYLTYLNFVLLSILKSHCDEMIAFCVYSSLYTFCRLKYVQIKFNNYFPQIISVFLNEAFFFILILCFSIVNFYLN